MAVKYLESMAKEKAEASIERDKSLLNSHILKEFGNLKPWEITSRDISSFFESIKGKKHKYVYVTSLDGIAVKKVNAEKFDFWLKALGVKTKDKINYENVTNSNLAYYLADYASTKQVENYIKEKGKISTRETVTTQGTVNKCKALLSHMYNTARIWPSEEWENIVSNPCTGIKSKQSNSKTRYLSKDELKRLFKILDSEEFRENKAAYFIKLLIFTGARKSELVNAKWEDIDFNLKMWNKPNKISKTKLAPPVPLSDDALNILTEMKEKDSEGYLFKSATDPNKPMNNCLKSYNNIMDRAEIKNCTFHDLRRTFGSQLLLAGVDIYCI